MADMTKKLIDLEMAMEMKKTEEAIKIITGLGEAKKKGHDKFTED